MKISQKLSTYSNHVYFLLKIHNLRLMPQESQEKTFNINQVLTLLKRFDRA